MPANVGLADRIFLLQESNHTRQHVAVLGTFTLPSGAAAGYLAGLVTSLRGRPT